MYQTTRPVRLVAELKRMYFDVSPNALKGYFLEDRAIKKRPLYKFIMSATLV